MTTQPRKKRLGIGLSELLGESDVAYALAPDKNFPVVLDAKKPYAMVPLSQIAPCAAQPRQAFNAASLEELAQSMRYMGVLQPLLITPQPIAEGQVASYRLLAGERRWRAAQLAQIDQVPCIIRHDTISDQQRLMMALIENIQRVDLNPLEEAEAYQQLIDYGLSHEEISHTVGKSRSHISNIVRLLRLPSATKQALIDGKINTGHAKVLLTTRNADQLAETISVKDLSVRQLEQMVHHNNETAAGRSEVIIHHGPSMVSDVDVRALQNELSAALGTAVWVKHHPSGRGVLQIAYNTCDQLEELSNRLQNPPVID